MQCDPNGNISKVVFFNWVDSKILMEEINEVGLPRKFNKNTVGGLAPPYIKTLKPIVNTVVCMVYEHEEKVAIESIFLFLFNHQQQQQQHVLIP